MKYRKTKFDSPIVNFLGFWTRHSLKILNYIFLLAEVQDFLTRNLHSCKVYAPRIKKCVNADDILTIRNFQ